jgi:hypothetical protein
MRPEPRRGEGRRQNDECRMMGKSGLKPGTCEVQARCLGGDWEVQARYMGGTCVVQARYEPPRSQGVAKEDGTLAYSRLKKFDTPGDTSGFRPHSKPAPSQRSRGRFLGAGALLTDYEPPRMCPSPCPLPASRGEGGRRPGEGRFMGSRHSALRHLRAMNQAGPRVGQASRLAQL